MAGVLAVSLAAGLGIGFLLPEEATRTDAAKLAAAIGFILAMALLAFEHHVGARAEEGRGGGGAVDAAAQTDDLAGLVPLKDLLAKRKPKTKTKKPANAAVSDGSHFFATAAE